MTLEEAIAHLDESLNDQGHDWGCEECKQEHVQLLEWLVELQEQRAVAEYPAKQWHEKHMEKIELREAELYQEIAIYHNGVQVGEAEIELTKKMLSKLVIYDSCQDKGYGTEAVKRLTEKYGIRDLWVRSDNERAIRCYKRCGYNIAEPTMFRMESPNCAANMKEV